MSLNSPDMARFMRVIEKTDLARPNLFLVRLGNFRTIITNDGIIDNQESIFQDQGVNNQSGAGDGDQYTWNRIQDESLNAAYKYLPTEAKSLMGAYDPSVVRAFGGGDTLDGFLGAEYDVNKDLALMVKSVNMPSSALEVQTNKTDRRPWSEVRSRSTGNITMTLFCTPGFPERRLMLMWMNSIHNNNKNTFGFYSNYAREIDILPLDRKGVFNSRVVADGCFPIRVGEVQLDVDSNSQVVTFEVEFTVASMSHVADKGKSDVIDQVESGFNRGQGSLGAFL